MKTTPSVTASPKITINKFLNQNVLMNSFKTKFHVQLKLLSVLNVVLNMSDLISCPPELNVFLHVTKSCQLYLYPKIKLKVVKKIALIKLSNKKILKKLLELMFLKKNLPLLKPSLKKLLLKKLPLKKKLKLKKSLKKLLLKENTKKSKD